MNELAKIDSFRKELAVAETIEQIKLIGDSAQAFQFILRRQNANKGKIDEIGEFDIEVECKKAEWLERFYPHGGDEKYKLSKIPNQNLRKMPVSPKESARAKKIKKYQKEKPEEFEKMKDKIKNAKDVNLNSKSISKEIAIEEKKQKHEQRRQVAEAVSAAKDSGVITDIEPGWHKVGNQFLYYGSNTDQQFLNFLKPAKFAFADPPYNANVDSWDNDFEWQQDYLQDFAEIVAVTPGGWNAFNFYKQTEMIYIWEMVCYIKNGMTHGKCGYANYIKAAIFGKGRVKIPQDLFSITIKTNETDDSTFKGRKPYDFMIHLIDLFTIIDDVVIDPFGGSGTTLLICEEMQRVSYNAEIQKVQCIEIINRAINKGMSYDRI